MLLGNIFHIFSTVSVGHFEQLNVSWVKVDSFCISISLLYKRKTVHFYALAYSLGKAWLRNITQMQTLENIVQ